MKFHRFYPEVVIRYATMVYVQEYHNFSEYVVINNGKQLTVFNSRILIKLWIQALQNMLLKINNMKNAYAIKMAKMEANLCKCELFVISVNINTWINTWKKLEKNTSMVGGCVWVLLLWNLKNSSLDIFIMFYKLACIFESKNKLFFKRRNLWSNLLFKEHVFGRSIMK